MATFGIGEIKAPAAPMSTRPHDEAPSGIERAPARAATCAFRRAARGARDDDGPLEPNGLTAIPSSVGGLHGLRGAATGMPGLRVRGLRYSTRRWSSPRGWSPTPSSTAKSKPNGPTSSEGRGVGRSARPAASSLSPALLDLTERQLAAGVVLTREAQQASLTMLRCISLEPPPIEMPHEEIHTAPCSPPGSSSLQITPLDPAIASDAAAARRVHPLTELEQRTPGSVELAGQLPGHDAFPGNWPASSTDLGFAAQSSVSGDARRRGSHWRWTGSGRRCRTSWPPCRATTYTSSRGAAITSSRASTDSRASSSARWTRSSAPRATARPSRHVCAFTAAPTFAAAARTGARERRDPQDPRPQPPDPHPTPPPTPRRRVPQADAPLQQQAHTETSLIRIGRSVVARAASNSGPTASDWPYTSSPRFPTAFAEVGSRGCKAGAGTRRWRIVHPRSACLRVEAPLVRLHR